MTLPKHFAARLEIIMKLRRISSRDFADAVGASRSATSKWLRGESLPEAKRLPAIANALGVTVDWLLIDAPPMTEAEAIAIILSEKKGLRL